MNDDKSHGGTLAKERDIPFFVIGECFSHQQSCAPKQTEICGIICELLSIKNTNKPITENLLLEKPLIDRQYFQAMAI